MERERMKMIKHDEVVAEKKLEPVPEFMDNLPQGIVSNIFSRLPLNTVWRCLWVRKSWLNRIKHIVFGDADFGGNHLDHMLKQHPEAATGFLLFMQMTNKSKHLECHLAEYVEDYTYKVNRIACPVWPFSSRSMLYKMIVGSCNGLVCLCQRISETTVDLDPVYIYNPMLREYLDLPGILNYSHKGLDETTIAMGFGFHPTTKKYKVVRIFYREAGVGEVEIYTLGDGEWKSKPCIPYQLQGTRSGVLVDGLLYWLIQKKKDQPLMIVSLDLDSEVFKVVQPPPQLPIPNPDTWTHFKEFGGYLTLAHVGQGGEEMKFWRLDNKTWITIECTVDDNMEFGYYQPYAFRRDLSEVLFACNPVTREEVLAFYVWRTKNLVEVVRMNGIRQHDVVPHTKSFVSLEAMGENARRMT